MGAYISYWKSYKNGNYKVTINTHTGTKIRETEDDEFLPSFAENVDVRDPYTGDKLVLTKQEAKAMYGDDWTRHLAESDHVKPLEKIYDDTKGNVWNTVDDIKQAANSDANIKVASRKFNNAIFNIK